MPRRAVWFATLLACACTSPSNEGGTGLGLAAGEDAGPSPFEAGAPTGSCDAVEQQQSIEGWNHVAVCSAVTYGTRPPSSGDHYPVWAAFQAYDTPVPEGFWVHDLEHGAIVISYNCREGCAADVAAATSLFDTLPDDPTCDMTGDGVRHRDIVTPDPKLDVPIAASAWGWTLRARCYDPVAFKAFAEKHYGQGREDLCDQGVDISAEPAGCGD